jgi:hypothetical protein
MHAGEVTKRFLRARPPVMATLGALVVLTVLAALPFDPEGPFDARTYERAAGVHLEFPAVGALIEPLAAAGHVVTGAPAMPAVGISTVVWAMCIAAAATLVSRLRRRERGVSVTVPDKDAQDMQDGRPYPVNPVHPCLLRCRWLLTALRALAAGALTGLVFTLYIGFAAVVHLPSWRLVADDPELVLADLHSHTFVSSHDGLVGPRRNLERHRACGFDVVAVTEHNDARGSLKAARMALDDASLPGVIPGIEFRVPGQGYLVSLHPFPPKKGAGAPGERNGPTREGAAFVARSYGFDVEGIRRVAAGRLDGFEIANFGHMELPRDVRSAVLDEAARRRLVLVASSDWHGWGGFFRTWTAVRVPGARAMSPNGKAMAVLAKVRGRRSGEVTPVVAGRMGTVSTARAVFAPFVETIRYAMELSWLRVAMWWVWVVALLAAAEGLTRAGFRSRRVLFALLLLVLGGGAVVAGSRMVGAWAAGVTCSDFPARVGGWAMGAGLAAVFAAAALVVLEIVRRSKELRARPASAAGAGEGNGT